MYFVRLLKNDYDFQKQKKNSRKKLEKNYISTLVILEYESFTAKVAAFLAAN